MRFGDKPVPWETLARQIWGGHTDRASRRDNFDVTRTRSAVSCVTSRSEDLVAIDGSGNVELMLYLGDRMVDET